MRPVEKNRDRRTATGPRTVHTGLEHPCEVIDSDPTQVPACSDCIIPASMSGKQRDSISRRGISRRNFGRRAALAGLATALDPSDLAAQGRGGNQTPLPPQDQAEVDAKFTDMVAKYGDRFTEDQKTRARGVLARHQRMLMRVRKFSLENGDAPATEVRLNPKGLKE
jgi:hypothetical protein